MHKNAVKEIVDAIIPALAHDPHSGTPLRGPLRGYWKYRVALLGVWYRIVYTINTKEHRITVIAIGSRGNFYDRLNRRLE